MFCNGDEPTNLGSLGRKHGQRDTYETLRQHYWREKAVASRRHTSGNEGGCYSPAGVAVCCPVLTVASSTDYGSQTSAVLSSFPEDSCPPASNLFPHYANHCILVRTKKWRLRAHDMTDALPATEPALPVAVVPVSRVSNYRDV